MRKPLIGLAIAVVILVIVAVAGVFVAPRAVAALYPLPENPVVYPHNLHAGTLQLDCQFCHRGASEGRAAIVPAVEQCMFCHKVAGLQNENAQVIRAAWESGEPLSWVRQHRIPDHTNFKHEPHINGGIDCAACHGDVASMVQVTPVRTLKMGDCVACHKQNGAPLQCSTCHN